MTAPQLRHAPATLIVGQRHLEKSFAFFCEFCAAGRCAFLDQTMNRTAMPYEYPAAFLIALISFPLAVRGQSAQKAELERAKHEYEVAVKQALQPVNRRYAATLQQLLKRATTAGDLDTAVKIKELLSQLEGVPLGTRLSGSRWTFPIENQPKDQRWIEFGENGVLLIGWASENGRTWRVISQNRAEFQPYRSKGWKFTVEFEPGLEKGRIEEGQHKGQQIERIK